MATSTTQDQPKLRDLLARLDDSDAPYSPNGGWTDFLLYTGYLDATQLKIRRGKGIPCPLCGGTDRFRYDNRKGFGNWFCSQCGGKSGTGGESNGWSLLSRLAGEAAAKDLLRAYYGGELVRPVPPPIARPAVAEQSAADEARRRELLAKVESLWSAGRPYTEATPSYYLRRGLAPLKDVQDTRHLASLGYFEANESTGEITKVGSFPALLALIRDPDGNPVAVHRTWLTPDRDAKAPVASPKKVTATPGIRGGAIRLYEADGSAVLGLVEGIETGHGVRQLAHDGYWPAHPENIPVWACVAERGIRSFVIPKLLLPTLKKIIVFADNDETGVGEAAAVEFKARMAVEHPSIEVVIEVPPVMGWDWLDVLINRN